VARTNTLEIIISAKDQATGVISGVMKSTGKSMMMVGGAMTLATAPLIAGLKGAVTAGASFESQMDNIQSILGSTDAETKLLTSDLLAFGAAALAGPEGVAAAFEEIAGGVEDASTHMAILEQSIKTAEAGQADLVGTTGAMVSVMNSYALSAADAAMVSDVLTRTVGMGVGSMEAFAGAFPAVTGLAASLGVSFQDVGTAAAFMTTKGFSAAQATNQLKAMMVSMLNPNAKMAESLAEIGFASGTAAIEQLGLVGAFQKLDQESNTFQANMAGAVGSVEALNGVIGLTDAAFNDFSNTYAEGLEGATDAAREIQLGNFEAQMGLLNSSIKALKITIGLALLPMLTALVKRIQPIVTGMVEWASKNSAVIETFAKIVAGVAALGAVLTVVGASIWLAGPLIAIAGAAKLLGFNFKKALLGLVGPFMSVVNFIGILVKNFGALYDAAKKFGLDSPLFFSQLWGFFGKERALQIKKFIDIASSAFGALMSVVGPVASAIGGAFGSITAKIDSIIETFNILSYVGKKFGVESRLFFQYLELVFGSQFAGIVQTFAVGVKNALNSVIDGIGNVIDTLRVLLDVGKTFGFDSEIFFQYLELAFGPKIMGGLLTFVDGLKSALNVMKDIAKGAGNFILDMITAFQTGGLEAVGALILDKIKAGFGIVKDWATENILDPIVAGIKGGAIGDAGASILEALKPGIDAIATWVNESILSPIGDQFTVANAKTAFGAAEDVGVFLLAALKPGADAVASFVMDEIIAPISNELGTFDWSTMPPVLDEILSAILTSISPVGDWLIEKVWTPLTTGLGDSVEVQNVSTKAGEIAAEILIGLANGLGDILGWVKTDIIDKIIEGLTGGGEEDGAEGGGKSLAENILLGIGNAFLNLNKWITDNVIAPFLLGLTGAESMEALLADGLLLGLKVLAGILDALADLPDWVLNEIILPLGRAIVEKAPEVITFAAELGLDILEGILDGLVGIGQQLWDFIKEEIAKFDFGSLIDLNPFGATPESERTGPVADALLGRALGGPVSASTPYIVGERGPELFVPQMAGRIIPNSQLGGGGSGGGGGSWNVVNMDGAQIILPGVTSARQFFDDLEREARRRNRQLAPGQSGLSTSPARGN